MTTSAERLIQLARDDYRMEIVPAEQLLSIMIDCAVALAFRSNRTPSSIFEDAFKTAVPDKRWRELLKADRENRERGDQEDLGGGDT